MSSSVGGDTSFPGRDPYCGLGVAPLAPPTAPYRGLAASLAAFREVETSSYRGGGRSEGRVMDSPPLATRGREERGGSKIVAGASP